ncbi:WD repeat-containing protein 89 [Sergentomyia squamirostris]
MLEKLCLDENQKEETHEECPDGDTVSETEISKIFTQTLHINSETAVSLQKNYVLHLDASGSNLVAGLSGQQIKVFDFRESSLTETHSWDCEETKEGGLCGVKFLNRDSNLFLSGQSGGSIVLHDKRVKEPVATFEDTTSGSRKPFTAFDVNCNDRVICAGTEQILHDVFLLFFDVRQRKLLGGYWESHEDDVTTLKFHLNDSNLLCSGSTDGLINVFDISKESECDALDYSLNTEQTVQLINWHQQRDGKFLLSSIMDSHDFHVYSTEDNQDSQLLSSFSREKISESIMRKSSIDCTTVGCHSTASGDIFLMAGSNYHDGECLRSLQYKDNGLHPRMNFIGNHQIIRSYIYDENNDLYVTGGENGIITIWSEKQNDRTSFEEKLKSVNRQKVHQTVKPY